MIFFGEKATSILKELKENYSKNCDDKKQIEALDYAINYLEKERERHVDYLRAVALSCGLRPYEGANGWYGYFHEFDGEYAIFEQSNGYIRRVKATDIRFLD